MKNSISIQPKPFFLSRNFTTPKVILKLCLLLVLSFSCSLVYSQKKASMILPDSRLKGNWKSDKLEILINIQNNNDVDLFDNEGYRTGGYWRSGISGGEIPEGESISFFSNWNKYIYGLSEIRFDSRDTMFAMLSNTQTKEMFIRQEVNYDLNSDDHPYYWDNNIPVAQFIIGEWYGNNGYNMIKFMEDGTLVNIDKYGNEKTSTWSLGESFMHEKYKHIEVFPVTINCCEDETLHEINKSGYDNYISLRYNNSKGRSKSKPIIKNVGNDRGMLSESQFAKIKNYFTGIWMTSRDVAMLSANHGIHLKEDGTFTTELSLGDSFNSSFGKSGHWSIYYDERDEHKTLYLDLYTSKGWTIHPTLKRHAINIESIDEDGFVSWEVTHSINDSYRFKRIRSFDEIYSKESKTNTAYVLLGLIVAKSIVEGITEEESARKFSSKKSESNRYIEIWQQEDTNWRREN